MSRMTAHRAALAALAATALPLSLLAAGPAHAHGAPTDPVSRAYACSPDGGARSGTAACRAARAANGGTLGAWDNLRIANVAGRDRQVVPDGRLCSGGLPAYRGLDAARSDWPATTLRQGATLTLTYASTIPHNGTFLFFLTRQGWDPSKPLRWSDLPERPFAQVRDPALSQGAYRMRLTLPPDRTGRHVLYTIWRNTSTPDTYYSCSDVVLTKAGSGSASGTSDGNGGSGGAAGARSSVSPSASASASKAARPSAPASTTPSAGREPSSHAHAPSASDGTPVGGASADTAARAGATPVSAPSSGGGPGAPLVAGGAAAVLVLTGGAALALRLRRR